MITFFKLKYTKPAVYALLILTFSGAGCTFQKQTKFDRLMQNVTAHYNILFDAKEILRKKQLSYASSFVDNYNEILSVYQDTTQQSAAGGDIDLDSVKQKANKIINLKEQSRYIGDAYMLLGEASFLGGNYFDAVEYFGYVVRSFPARSDLVQQGLTWKARSLIYLNQLPQAKLAIDSAIQAINPKKKVDANIYATKMEYDIDAGDYADGVSAGKLTVQYCRDKNQRLRWTFILAQLEELNHEPAEALKNYARIAKSNVLFEMAFNASLNIIRIEDNANGVKIDRVARLMALLKDPDNNDFKDQIYYQVAQIEYADKNIAAAVKNYNLSVRSSLKNSSQKGLSYLRLAEIYFGDKADYLNAKKYYDSTLMSLPPTFPGYAAIKKKNDNLQIIADRLQIITREDTLQALAGMSEKKRDSVIDKMVSDKILKQQQDADAAASAAIASTPNSGPGNNSYDKNSTFYFDNPAAVGQGIINFKRIWGNRKLQDNWRISSSIQSAGAVASVSAVNTTSTMESTDPDAPVTDNRKPKTTSQAADYRRELMENLPLTPGKLAQSNQRIYSAYDDLGDFYRDLLDDKQEAIGMFETLLRRFPVNPNTPAVYYNLYRLYSTINREKSDEYKSKLLKEFPNTPFARIIINPDYVKQLENKDARFVAAYNSVFDLYADKKYRAVAAGVPQLLKEYPGNKYAAQLVYLQTLAQGHYEKEGPFMDSLQQIVKKYPADRLITPLVKQHIAFINANLAEIEARDTVIPDNNPDEVPFTLAEEYKENAAYRRAVQPYRQVQQTAEARPQQTEPLLAGKKTAGTAQSSLSSEQAGQSMLNIQSANGLQQNNRQPGVAISGVKTLQGVTNPAANKPSVFSMRDSSHYYFAVNVTTATINLASSRFGIGQFNRVYYADAGISHHLKDIGNDDQLIFVGPFPSLETVKKYARQIIPLLPDIMKVPKDEYSFFIITKENLDKLAAEKTLNSYIDFYQNNY